jgi:GT2 family glycosyltransferase
MPAASPPSSVTAIFIAGRPSSELEGAIASVIAQQPRPTELVLFGNGCEIVPPNGLPEDLHVVSASSPVNLGVARGRNAATSKATGDYLLFVDDDAILLDGSVDAAVQLLDDDPRVGAVAFAIRDPRTHRPALWYYADPPELAAERRFDAPWLIGCANLIRRDLFLRLNGFWEGYFRELEEIDLSWRILSSGHRILYEPLAKAEHEERSSRHTRYSLASNLMVAWRLLPIRLALRQSAFFLALFSARAIRYREPLDVLAGLWDFARRLPRVLRERDPLDRATVAYLRSVYSRQGLGKRLRWSLRRRSARPPFETR